MGVSQLTWRNTMTNAQKTQRMNIRNGFLVASQQEANQGVRIHLDNRDFFAAACIVELLQEDYDLYQNLTPKEIDVIEIQLTNVIGS